MIGAKSAVIQCVNVGDNCVVGAGAVIIRDLVSDSTAVGVPARII
jgi:serine acetyltransferase